MAIDTSGASVGGRVAPPRRALVDTNVALDLLLGREPWASQAKPMWDARDAGFAHAGMPVIPPPDIGRYLPQP